MANSSNRMTIRRSVTVERSRHEKVPGFEWRYRVAEKWDEECEVELSIDINALAKSLGAQAAHQKTGKSRLRGGLIVAKIVGRVESNRRKVDE